MVNTGKPGSSTSIYIINTLTVKNIHESQMSVAFSAIGKNNTKKLTISFLLYHVFGGYNLKTHHY